MIRVYIAAFLLALFTACSTTNARTKDEDIKAVRAVDDAIHAAVEAGNLDAVMTFWTEDAVMLPPNLAAVEGRDAVRSFFEKAFKSMTLQPERSSKQVVVSGDLAVHRGSTVANYTPTGKATINDPQKWIDVYRRQSDGSWKVWLTIWNSDLPASTAVFTTDARD